jgi:N-acetyl-1-D-myo-inositol-2-amino-2-deoxy-alpha-D-glucopyranoside deacetylase
VTEQRIRLLAVFAHPDDDVYTIGGTWVLHRDRLDVTLVFCTSGDAGPIWVDGVERADLGPVREHEQSDSMAALGVDADVLFLHHRDLHLPDVPFGVLVGQIEKVLRGVRPHLVVTFGPDGWSGHHDHTRAGEATDAAFEHARPDGDSGARLLHVCTPMSVVDRFDDQLRAAGDPDREVRSLLALRGVPDGDVAVAVDTRPVRETKLAGIEAHRTQIGELERLPESLRWIVLDTEWFVQAWPRDVARDAMSADPFADLL